jgi:hypothetical protein
MREWSEVAFSTEKMTGAGPQEWGFHLYMLAEFDCPT